MTQNEHMPTNDFDDLATRIDAHVPQVEHSTEEPEVLNWFEIPDEPDYEAMQESIDEHRGGHLAEVRDWAGER